MITPEIVADLTRELDPAYAVLADIADVDPYIINDREIWTQPLCHTWAQAAYPLAQSALRGTGISLFTVTCNPNPLTRSTHRIPRKFHNYLMVRSAADDKPYVIDGTWQQFRPNRCQPRPELPRIIIAAAADIPTQLTEAGIDPGIHFVWRPDLYNDDVFETLSAPPRENNYDRIFQE